MTELVEIGMNGCTARLGTCDAASLLEQCGPSSADLLITSPPYCIGKEYDQHFSPSDFLAEHLRILPRVMEVVKDGGSICWQVGYHVSRNEVMPLDFLILQAAQVHTKLKLRNRIVWKFGHGAHSSRRFSGRHEVVLWFTKGEKYLFDLDSVRTRQKYPGKRHYKGPHKGSWSGNPLGKNPEDVWEVTADIWEIPNVKANHVEKTEHPCQFPVALAARLVRALCPREGVVVDPYLGSGSSAVAALCEGRNFIGSDTEPRYIEIAKARLTALRNGTLRTRPDTPIHVPQGNEAVAQLPPHFVGDRDCG